MSAKFIGWSVNVPSVLMTSVIDGALHIGENVDFLALKARTELSSDLFVVAVTFKINLETDELKISEMAQWNASQAALPYPSSAKCSACGQSEAEYGSYCRSCNGDACTVEDEQTGHPCGNKIHSAGLCPRHYQEDAYPNGCPKIGATGNPCGNPTVTKGLCHRHYQEHRARGPHHASDGQARCTGRCIAVSHDGVLI